CLVFIYLIASTRLQPHRYSRSIPVVVEPRRAATALKRWFSVTRRNALFRTILLEPLVMLATVLQWLVLSIVTGALVGSGVSLFLLALFALSGRSQGLPLWLHMLLLPAGGLVNGLLLYYGYRLNKTGLRDSAIAAVHDQHGCMPLKTFAIKPVAALVTLASGGSAGKEGPCSHIGASLGAGL